jgi:Glucose / Sorbosone dehydrogenase
MPDLIKLLSSCLWRIANSRAFTDDPELPLKGCPLRRESLLGELRQRIREVRQGPDRLLYLLTDEDDGAMLRIEPIP